MIGYSYETKKETTLTVVERVDKGSRYYYLECSVCSTDNELWPYKSIRSSKYCILDGKVSCGCAKNPQWTRVQHIVRLNRRAESLGIVISAFPEGKINSCKSKIIVYDGVMHHSVIINNFLIRGVPTDSKRNIVYVKQKMELTGKFPLGFDVNPCNDTNDLGHQVFCSYYCPVCAKDIYTLGGASNGWFISKTTSLTQGWKPCRCRDNGYKWSPDERRIKLDILLNQFGGKFVEFCDDNVRKGTKFIWMCNEGHKNDTEICHFINGHTRCAICSKTGYDRSKTGRFYVVRWSHNDSSFIKFGITNLKVKLRVSNQSKKTYYKPSILHILEGSGQDVWDVERSLKVLFGNSQNCDRKFLPDGYTETVYDTEDNISTLLQMCSTLTRTK